MNNRRGLYILPVLGVAFGLWYVKNSFVDVVYSDYIRLVNSYLPDVWNPDKFLVGDILTRIPLNYMARIINTAFFGYRIRFDQALGVLSLGLAAALLVSYCVKREVGALWTACLMAVAFSLNKWEMMINGSGWTHFLAFAGFYYHYLVVERLWTGQEKKGDKIRCLLLPWILTLAVAGPYCAIYTVTLGLTYIFRLLMTWRRERRWDRQYVCYGISALIPLLLYMWSNAQVTEKVGVVVDVPFVTQFLETPGYMVRFFVKSFASMVIGGECAQAVFSTDAPYLILGTAVMAAYGLALWIQWRDRLYERTIFPLLLTGAGVLNHLLVLYSRWVFMNEEYGMSSRYAIQFQVGIFGVLLTFAMAGGKRERKAASEDDSGLAMGRGVQVPSAGSSETPDRRELADRRPDRIGRKVFPEKGQPSADADRPGTAAGKKAGTWTERGVQAAVAVIVVVLLAGNGYTTIEELRKAPFRKEACQRRAEIALDFENRSDDELRASFEYRTGRPESGQAVRSALEILKKNRWNIFRELQEGENGQ